MPLKIACGQMEVIPGRPDLNTRKMLQMIEQARAEQADVILFPEMAIPGYLIGDRWEQPAYLDDCVHYGEEVVATSRGITVVFGNVAVEKRRFNHDGHPRKYNAAFVAQDGRLLPGMAGKDFVMKAALPNYREFDDPRYFTAAPQECGVRHLKLAKSVLPVPVTIRGQEYRFGIMLCEDGWTEHYPFHIPRLLVENGAQILCNISCSPFTLGKNGKRHRVFGSQAAELKVPVVYCNNIGVQNNGKDVFTCDGQSCVYGPNGRIQSAAPMYSEYLLTFTWDEATDRIRAASYKDEIVTTEDDEAEVTYKALRFGLDRFLKQAGINRMVLGISGGIDSAVAAALYANVLGPRHVLLINMPSQYNSALTKSMAQQLAENIGANYTVVPITESITHTVNQLYSPIHSYESNRDFKLALDGLMYQNIQARDRGSRLLAGFAAAYRGGFSCNANKAELSVGYGTFYGDIAGVIAPLGDLWKHQVYALGHYLNETVYHKEAIPRAIFEIQPSAELCKEQTVGNGGDPLRYEYHDYLLRAFVENWDKASPVEILEHYMNHDLDSFLGCAPGTTDRVFHSNADFCADLERWYGLFTGLAVAKRIQAPPVLALSRRAYGYDYREAQLPAYLPRRYGELKAELLKQERLF